MAVIEIKALHKTFRDFWQRPRVKAVDGLDLSVNKGRIMGLLGPNGSGKSTTIKMLLGLLHPTTGTVRVLNDAPGSPRTAERIGYLPEETYLHRFLSPRETLHFYGKLFAMRSSERRNRVEQLLEMLDLREAADRRVGELSKGMARRVGLAQALINDPDLLILDEPTSGLDPIGCRQVKDLILSLAQREKTILLTSHLLADVEDVCDHIAILYRGSIRTHGPTTDLLTNREDWNIRLPGLSPAQLKEALQTLRTALGTEPTATHPTIGLEQLFLGIIAEAEGGQAPAQEATAAFLQGTTGNPSRLE